MQPGYDNCEVASEATLSLAFPTASLTPMLFSLAWQSRVTGHNSSCCRYRARCRPMRGVLVLARTSTHSIGCPKTAPRHTSHSRRKDAVRHPQHDCTARGKVVPAGSRAQRV